MGEVADVLICIIDLLNKSNPKFISLIDFEAIVDMKLEKWNRVYNTSECSDVKTQSEWYENIPEDGILVTNGEGNIEHISQYDSDAIHNGWCWCWPISSYDPIPSSIWWSSAPWKSIKTAPKDEPILVINAEGTIQHSSWSEIEDNWGNNGFSEVEDPVAWLPSSEGF